MKELRFALWLLAIPVLLVSSCKQPDMEVSTTVEVPVGVIEVSTASIEEVVSTTGSVYPSKEVTLSSEITRPKQVVLVHYSGTEDRNHHGQEIFNQARLQAWVSGMARTAGFSGEIVVPGNRQRIQIDQHGQR